MSGGGGCGREACFSFGLTGDLDRVRAGCCSMPPDTDDGTDSIFGSMGDCGTGVRERGVGRQCTCFGAGGVGGGDGGGPAANVSIDIFGLPYDERDLLDALVCGAGDIFACEGAGGGGGGRPSVNVSIGEIVLPCDDRDLIDSGVRACFTDGGPGGGGGGGPTCGDGAGGDRDHGGRGGLPVGLSTEGAPAEGGGGGDCGGGPGGEGPYCTDTVGVDLLDDRVDGESPTGRTCPPPANIRIPGYIWINCWDSSDLTPKNCRTR